MRKILASCLLAATLATVPAVSVAAGEPASSPVTLSSMGDAAMGPLMDALFADYHARHANVGKGLWSHTGATASPDGLANYVADIAPIVGKRNEMMYRVRFQRNGVTAPFIVQVGSIVRDSAPVPLQLAANGGTGRPLDPKVADFLGYVVSPEGQAIVAKLGATPLTSTEVEQARAALAANPYVQSEAPPYRAKGQVAGPISSVGSIQMVEWIDRALLRFQALHPGVVRGPHWRHPGSSAAISGLLADVSDIAPLGREVSRKEKEAYRARFGVEGPTEIRIAHGARKSEIRTNAVAIYVNAANPIASLSVAQLDAIYSAVPHAGASAPIRTWGDAGLKGEWRDRPIAPLLYGDSGAPGSIQRENFRNDRWADTVRTLDMKEVSATVSADPAAIGFGAFDDPTPGIRVLPLSFTGKGPASSGSWDDVMRQRYPLTRHVYILVRRNLSPQTREFLRFLLSREGQEIAVLEGYAPLTRAEAEAGLAQVDAL